ncbi:MAG: glycosyltransferase [Myxococcota bacterium]
MAEVLMVSKPVEAPWNDSSKNLVRDVAAHLPRHQPLVMGRGGLFGPPRAGTVPVYSERSRFAPSLASSARVLLHLLLRSRAPLWHFFFAPNPKTSAAGRAASRLRRVRTLHTICSAPRRSQALRRILFADCNVVLSAHTEARLAAEGIASRRIPPAIPLLDVPAKESRDSFRRKHDLSESPLVVYPGDLEFGGGASLVLRAAAELSDVQVVMACRRKTPEAEAAAATLQRFADANLPGRVQWWGETRKIHQLLGAADVVALPSTDLYAKMDYPLVLLEAMAMERGVVVAQGTPAAELAQGGAAIACAATEDDVGHAILAAFEDAELGTRARARVIRDHDPRGMAAAYADLYDELLG